MNNNNSIITLVADPTASADYYKYHVELITDMNLVDLALKEASHLRIYEYLYSLLSIIAQIYPDKVVTNPGDVIFCPCLCIQDSTLPCYELNNALLNYRTFRKLYDYLLAKPTLRIIEYDLITLFVLALWAEINYQRRAMIMEKIPYVNHDEDVYAIIEAHKKEGQQAAEAGGGISQLPDHYTIEVQNMDALCALPEVIKAAHWQDGTISVEDWVYRLSGIMINGKAPSLEPITLNCTNQCRCIIKHLIYRGRRVSQDEWRWAAHVFAAKDGDMAHVADNRKTPSGCGPVLRMIKEVYRQEKNDAIIPQNRKKSAY